MLQKLPLFLLLTMLPSIALGLEHWQGTNYIIRSFIEVALKNEYKPGMVKVRKWNKPIQLWLDYQMPEMVKGRVADKALHRQLIRMHTKQLSDLTGQYIGFVNDRSNANVQVVLTTAQQWRSQIIKNIGVQAADHATTAVCMAGLQVNDASEVASAVVIIPVDQAISHRKLVTCIVEELTQIMGLPNDSDAVFPSIFNDQTPDTLLTGLDALLLQMLYHPDMKAGMTVVEALPVMRHIVAEWRIDGTIENASHQVLRGELYPMMGYEMIGEY